MSEYVVDTHALFWHLVDSPRLGTNCRSIFANSANGNTRLYIPSIVLAELHYVNVKLGYPMAFSEEFARIAAAQQFEFVDFCAEDTLRFYELSAIPEMHDRIIVSVAYAKQCPLLTHDAVITASRLVEVVW